MDLELGFYTSEEEIVKNHGAKSQISVKEQVGDDKVKIGIFFPKNWLLKKGWGHEREVYRQNYHLNPSILFSEYYKCP